MPEETFWAIRTFFEALARRHPLVLVFDDIQWGEPTLLELIEHIADWSTDVPMMLLCLARPDFLETNRSWGGGKLNATSLLLEPLRSEDGDALVRNLLGSAELAPRERGRIVEVAGGNPLVRRGDPLDADRRRSADAGGRSVGPHRRPRRRSRSRRRSRRSSPRAWID